MKRIIIFICLFNSQVFGGLYSNEEISQYLKQQQNKPAPLIVEILTSRTPLKTFDQWLLAQNNPLDSEYQILALLNQLASTPPDDIFTPLIKQLSHHQSQTVIISHEANHPSQGTEAAFKISSKAAGIINIWHMKRIQQQATNILTKGQKTVEQISQMMISDQSHNATLLGIKNALNQINDSQIERFRQALFDSPHLHASMNPVIANVALKTTDNNFITWAIAQADKQQAERIYRTIAQQNPKQQTIEILTQDFASQANPAFVASLLTPYIDNPIVTNFLLKQLQNPSAVKGAAYALSKSSDPLVWEQMKLIHRDSQSHQIKKSISFSFKRNKEIGAQRIYKNLENQSLTTHATQKGGEK